MARRLVLKAMFILTTYRHPLFTIVVEQIFPWCMNSSDIYLESERFAVGSESRSWVCPLKITNRWCTSYMGELYHKVRQPKASWYSSVLTRHSNCVYLRWLASACPREPCCMSNGVLRCRDSFGSSSTNDVFIHSLSPLLYGKAHENNLQHMDMAG